MISSTNELEIASHNNYFSPLDSAMSKYKNYENAFIYYELNYENSHYMYYFVATSVDGCVSVGKFNNDYFHDETGCSLMSKKERHLKSSLNYVLDGTFAAIVFFEGGVSNSRYYSIGANAS